MNFIIKIINGIIDFFLVFFFLFELPFFGSSLITTRRLSVLCAIIYLIFNSTEVKCLINQLNKNNLKRVLAFLCGCLFLLVISSTAIISKNNNNDYFELQYIAYIVLYVLVFPLFCAIRFKSVKYFTFIYSLIFLVQFVVVIYAYVNTSFRLLIFELFYFGDDRFDQAIEWGSRIMGIGLHSSSGSITCSTSIILLSYLVLKKQLYFPVYLVLSGVFLIMTLFIGRTGVLVEIIVFLYVLKNYKLKLIYKVLVIVPFVLVFFSFFTRVLDSSDANNKDSLTKWMTGAFNSEEQVGTMQGINRKLPPVSAEFILGTGVMTGKTPSGTSFSTDSGYVMLYCSLGIFGALLYYLSFYNMFKLSCVFRHRDKTIRLFFKLLILLAYIIEYKEPYLLKYTFPYMLVTLSLLIAKEEDGTNGVELIKQ